ncbi:MAG: hypothetical protein RJB43_952, partial [Verrucomicrobiota bacterium]
MHLSLWSPHHTQGVIGGGHVLISGAPGAGKSHLLREAIIPALVASGAQVLVIDYADVIGAMIKGLRREVYGEETFGISNPNAPSPAPGLLGSSAIATLACERAGRDAMADLLLRSLYVELVKNPPDREARRFLVVDISHQSSALSTFGPLLREAVKNGFTLIVTCQSPSALDDDLFALFSTHVCFYHFFKRCLKIMSQALLSTDPSMSPQTVKGRLMGTYAEDAAQHYQFTREQLAGDLLPQVTSETRIASGYNKLLNTTEEGGAQPREYTAK